MLCYYQSSWKTATIWCTRHVSRHSVPVFLNLLASLYTSLTFLYFVIFFFLHSRFSQQLAQSGSALICVILHTQANKRATDQQLFIVALEGLSACIAVLRHLGERVSSRPFSISPSRN